MNTEYVTVEGDRWDTIAYKAYGDASKFQQIIEANPEAVVGAVFEPGIRLIVPIVETVNSTDKNLLPPWKRGETEGETSAALAAFTYKDIKPSIFGGSFDGSFDESFD